MEFKNKYNCKNILIWKLFEWKFCMFKMYSKEISSKIHEFI